MRGRHRRSGHGGLLSVGALIAAAAVVLMIRAGSPAPADPGATDDGPGPFSDGPRSLAHRREAPVPEFGPPLRVVIPAIGVDARVVRLGLNPDGTLEVPSDFAETGWWSGGTVPGREGPAVIVGHVDSKSGPAVFFRLRELEPGDVVVVSGAKGSLARFVVQRSEWVAKDAFPTQRVYGPVPYAALRLITCGGVFDRQSGHYLDNLVVYGQLAEVDSA